MEKNIQLENIILEELIKNPKEYLERKKGRNIQGHEIDVTLDAVKQIQKTLDQVKVKAAEAADTTWTC
jgi:hypothetical protein